MDDFAEALGLAAAQKERLLSKLGVEDEELTEAKRLVQQQEEEIAKLWQKVGRLMSHENGYYVAV